MQLNPLLYYLFSYMKCKNRKLIIAFLFLIFHGDLGHYLGTFGVFCHAVGRNDRRPPPPYIYFYLQEPVFNQTPRPKG